MSMSEGYAEQAPPLASPGGVGNRKPSPRGMGMSHCSLKTGSTLPQSMVAPVVLCCRELVLRGEAGPEWGGAGSTPHLMGGIPVEAWADQLSYHPDTQPGLLLGTPQHLPYL